MRLPNCQEAAHYFLRIALESRPFSVENYRNSLAAESRLTRLEMLEDLAELYETETNSRLRQRFADQFREKLGVVPELRHTFRCCLKHLVETGAMPVDDLIARLERQASGS